MVASIASKTLHIEPKNSLLQIGNKKTGILIDSGRVCSILNESLATKIIGTSSLARWLKTATSKDHKTIANEQIPAIGMIKTPVKAMFGKMRMPNWL